MSQPDDNAPREWIGRQLWSELSPEERAMAERPTPRTGEQLTQRALGRLLTDAPLLAPPAEIWERPNKEELAARFVLAGQTAILQELRPETNRSPDSVNHQAQHVMFEMLGVIGEEMKLSQTHEDAIRAIDYLEAYLEGQIASTTRQLKEFQSGPKTP